MATRIFELAQTLGVTSKVVLAKCRAEGLEVKNHMSTVSAGLEATIREWFSEEAAAHTAVETTEHVDLAKARAEARKSRRRRKPKDEPVEEAAGEGEASAAPGEAPAPVEGDVVAEATDVVEAEVAAPVEAVEEPAEQAEPSEPPEGAESPAEAPAVAATVEPAEPEPEEEEPKKPEVIVPAGPQVVPKPAQLKGPRVIRVEKPDYVARPRRRPTPAAGGADAPPETTGAGRRGRRGAAPAVGQDGQRKTQRRSPRRRGGRSADSGEKLKEWRDQDLQERQARLAAATGGGLRRHRASEGRRMGGGGPSVKTGKVEIDEPITIKNLSAATGLKSAAIIQRLMGMGLIATVNQVIDRETAEAVVVDYEIELVVHRAKTAEEVLLEEVQAREKGDLAPRAPVVTFLGHVDHGKTSLLDRIRETSVATGEAGGITQHVGAYRYDVGDKHVVFLDTPGHEAFTAMRARGANMTDVVVLVVAADDGVMPQTVEAISHARAAEVPIVVALNKVDVPNANVQRALGQLAENGLQPRQWGGEVEVIETSAETGQGIEELVELLNLEAELLELAADKDQSAIGYIIEAKMDTSLGATARLLVLDGTLRIGDVLLAGKGYGRVRRMVDANGLEVDEAGPATPVEVSGLDEVPEAGDRFYVTEDIDRARSVAEDRRARSRTESLAMAGPVTLENLFSHIEAGEVNEVAFIVKGDVQGTVEALVASLNKQGTDEIRLNVIHHAVGGITTGDVTLAEASNAIIIGFNVVPDAKARKLAEKTGVDIRLYRVIYEILEDVRKVLSEGLAPEIRVETLGRAEVRQVFKVSRVGTIAGCYVTDGLAARNAKVRITRDNVVIEDERSLDSLKRFKDDAREVRAGMECGVKLAGYDDVKEGDILEFYRQVEIARHL